VYIGRNSIDGGRACRRDVVHQHEAVHQPLLASQLHGDARLEQPLGECLAFVTQGIVLGGDDQRRRHTAKIGSVKGADAGVRPHVLVGHPLRAKEAHPIGGRARARAGHAGPVGASDGLPRFRTAERLHAPFDVLWVKDGDHNAGIRQEDVGALERLVETLGGTLLIRQAADLVGVATQVARERGATYLVIGRPRHRTHLGVLSHRHPPLELMSALPDIDVQIVALADPMLRG
jgi:hypothetical protein